jgi:hypothetical protein
MLSNTNKKIEKYNEKNETKEKEKEKRGNAMQCIFDYIEAINKRRE